VWRPLCVTWFIVCAVEYEAPAVLRSTPFSYCKIDVCELNGDRTDNTESTCKFTARNAHYWTHNGNVSFQAFTAVVVEMIIVWVFIRCGIISFHQHFARTCCHHIQGDWIRFKWMLKWLEEAKWGRYTISSLSLAVTGYIPRVLLYVSAVRLRMLDPLSSPKCHLQYEPNIQLSMRLEAACSSKRQNKYNHTM